VTFYKLEIFKKGRPLNVHQQKVPAFCFFINGVEAGKRMTGLECIENGELERKIEKLLSK